MSSANDAPIIDDSSTSPRPAAGTGTGLTERGLAARAALATAVIAGVFVVAVAALLLWDYSRRVAKDPLESAEFKALKRELAQNPKDEAIKERIRDLDLQLRETYFRQRAFASRGAWLMLGGIAVLLAAAKTDAVLRRRPPMPQPQEMPQDPIWQSAGVARWAVGGLAGGLVLLAVALGLGVRSGLSEIEPSALAGAQPVPNPTESPGGEPRPVESQSPPAGQPQPAPSTVDQQLAPQPKPSPGPAASGELPSKEEFAKSWPRFRGPGGTGVSAYQNVPTTWDAASGKGIVWKVPVPLPGNGSPIVWKDRIFLSGATPEKRQVLCFSTADGKLLWQKDVPGTPESTAKPPELNDDTGFAASTPATDGRRVFAIFANGDVAAFDFEGNLVWARSLGIPKNSYGHASSLVTWRDRLMVQFDQGAAKENKSRLLALDAASGKTVWETPRPVPNCWSTPLVIEVKGQEQIVAAGDPWVIGYSPADGKEIWKAKCLRQDVGPSPTFSSGVVYTASEFPQLSAIRADGTGDVTATHILWSGEDGLPDTCSPLATPDYVILLSSAGTMTCYAAKDGKKLWEQDFEANFKASPSLVGKNVYILSDEGKFWVVEPGPTGCKKLAEGSLGEGCVASPAFQEGRVYIRGKTHLFGIGEK